MEWERGCILANCLGVLRRQLDECIAHARARKQFGKSIGKFQSVANRLVDMRVRLDTCRPLVYRIGMLKDRGEDATTEAAIAKLHVSDCYVKSSLDAVQVFGGYGYMTEQQMERDLRDANRQHALFRYDGDSNATSLRGAWGCERGADYRPIVGGGATGERTREAIAAAFPTLLQLALATAVVYLYHIENPAFERVFVLAVAGFAINLAVPMAYRLRFFVALSLAGVFVVFGPRDGAWLIAASLALIGIANIPVSLSIRAGALVAVGAVLAIARAGLVPSPWSPIVWPILGAMFMFRLALYVLALKKEPKRDRGWWALAYFFMLPNLVFPLFPVVDYETFRRTHYDRPQGEISTNRVSPGSAVDCCTSCSTGSSTTTC
jgi:hypothetical protein